MKLLLRGLHAVHALLAILFALASLILIFIAAKEGWAALLEHAAEGAAQQLIDAIGVLAAAVVALQIAQTIIEEEVVRDAHVAGPTRVRRFLSRFLVVLVVALTIEGLVATFRAAHEDSAQMLHAAALVAAAGFLLIGWGLFVHLNRSAEELEPEAMEDAKDEDAKLS